MSSIEVECPLSSPSPLELSDVTVSFTNPVDTDDLPQTPITSDD